MTFKDIINKATWREVAIALVSEYPCQRKNLEGYQIVFDLMQVMEPEDSPYVIYVERRQDIRNPDITYPDVFGKRPAHDEQWSLLFATWSEWLGMTVSDETTKLYSVHQITAYCLNEMTFFGFTEEKRKEQEASLDASINEADEHPEELTVLDPEELHFEMTMKSHLRCLDRWLRWGNVAKEYYGRDSKWFKKRFLDNEAPERYDELERQTLKAALKEIARDICEIARQL